MYWNEIDRPIGRRVPIRTSSHNASRSEQNTGGAVQTMEPTQSATREPETDWQALAMRLQADMASITTHSG